MYDSVQFPQQSVSVWHLWASKQNLSTI